MTSKEFVEKLLDIATHYKTLYVMGCFGAPLTTQNKKRYIDAWSYNQSAERRKMINDADTDTFGFDCVNLIKAVLWGWSGNKTANYGGAKYNSFGVPDVSANKMITMCVDAKSTNWSGIEAGELVWMQGHVGIYVGNGLVVECSPRWANGVQITALLNKGSVEGYHGRKWTMHAKLPWIEYVKEDRELAVGDHVHYKGGKHYLTASSDFGFNAGAGEATVTIIAKTKRHPYHIIHTNNSTSKVYGWVDADSIERS